MVSMMDSHSYDRGSNPGQGKSHIQVLHALNRIQLISDDSSARLVLYLYEYAKCIASSIFVKRYRLCFLLRGKVCVCVCVDVGGGGCSIMYMVDIWGNK